MITANEAKKLVDGSKIKVKQASEAAAEDFLTVFERYLKKIAAEGRTELIVSHSSIKDYRYSNEIEIELQPWCQPFEDFLGISHCKSKPGFIENQV